jgi:hypothetical protein
VKLPADVAAAMTAVDALADRMVAAVPCGDEWTAAAQALHEAQTMVASAGDRALARFQERTRDERARLNRELEAARQRRQTCTGDAAIGRADLAVSQLAAQLHALDRS